ncbi:ABC transporter permease [Alphaproteobacteria bacterium]|nr:ABC transporter permease [Alphaproteobacteria bacterium]
MSTHLHDIDSTKSHTRAILLDLRAGFLMHHLWARLGWNDILQRYRRSILGPVWLTISMGVLIGALGLLYAKLFKVDVVEYIPFLTIGFVLWQLISGILLDGCNVFVHSEGIIKQIKLPFSLHVYRILWRNFLTLMHNSVIIVLVMIYFERDISWNSCFAMLGLFFIILNGGWFSFLIGMLCARYRDLNPTIASLVTLSFFVTPIIWNPSLIPDRAFILVYNPFFHFVESVRAPLLGDPVSPETWWILIAITVVGWILAIPVISRMSQKLVYWL